MSAAVDDPDAITVEEEVHVAPLLAAADRIYKHVVDECKTTSLFDEPELLHMLVMTWVNSYVDAGLIEGKDPSVDKVTTSMANLSGKLRFIRERRGH